MGGQDSYLTVRKLQWDGSRMGWDGGVVLPMVSAHSTCWMDAVYCRGAVGVVSGKRNVSKVSPGLGWYQYVGSGILGTAAHGSMMVNRTNPHRLSPGSNPRKSLINSIFSQRNWRVETMGNGITSLCDGDVSLLL